MYQNNDIDWTWDGDFVVGNNGDFLATQPDPFKSLRTEIATIVRSEMGDWSEHPKLGAGLSAFIGKPNSKEIGLKIEQTVRSALVQNMNVKLQDLDVSVTPITIHTVLLTITVRVETVPSSEYAKDGTIIIALSYDTLEDTVIFYDVNLVQRQGR